MDERTRESLEAAAFRRLVAHLRERTDVQNIDLMNLAASAATAWATGTAKRRRRRASRSDKDEAREIVYGMPPAEWKKRYQKEATPEQQAAFAAVAKDPQLEARAALRGRGTRGLGSAPFGNDGISTMAKSGFAKEHLRSFIDRIERLEEERTALTADIREVYSEAKGTGLRHQDHAPGRAHAETRQGRPPGTGSDARSLSECAWDALS